jgi:hypothetical protein
VRPIPSRRVQQPPRSVYEDPSPPVVESAQEADQYVPNIDTRFNDPVEYY